MSSSVPSTTLPTPPESERPVEAVDPTDGTDTAPPPATNTQTDSSQPTQPAASTDPFSALSSMWSGWLSQSSQPAADSNNTSNATATTTAGQPNATSGNPAADLLSGAGKMWNDLGATLKDAAGNVDTTMLGEQVTVIREQSGRFMEDVSRSVQQLNISLPSAENIDLGKSAQAITSSTKDFLDKASQSLEQGRKEALEIFVDADESTNGSGQNSTSNMGSTNGTDPTAANKNIESGTVEGASLGKDSKQGYAPWDVAALPDGEKPYADALRTEMLKLVVDAIYSRKKRTSLFLSDVARKRGYEFDLERRSGEALAALEADKNMRRLRAGLVPGKMKEDVFWQTYFYHVHRIRQTLVANEGVMPETLPEDEEDEDDLFGEENEKADTEVESGKTESANDPKPDKSIPEGPGEKSEAVSADVKKTDENTAGADEEGERDWDEELDAAFG